MTAGARPFAGQVALIATLHGKDRALAPTLEQLGFEVRAAAGLDTDRFGTFTGEVERTGTMLDAARDKARAAFSLSSKADWIIASEGAFGPSAVIPMLAEAKELLLAWRPGDDLEVTALHASFETNFAHLDDPDAARLDAFLKRAGFPHHAVIAKAGGAILAKGVTDRAALGALIAGAAAPVRIETDMRAHLNPTRMGEIAKAADALAKRLAVSCPACAKPGFGLSRVERGLPCSACGTPTERVVAEVRACPACHHENHHLRADGLTKADPGECPVCNP
jgi:hypothetical protein